jgi:hypothetical protein
MIAAAAIAPPWSIAKNSIMRSLGSGAGANDDGRELAKGNCRP